MSNGWSEWQRYVLAELSTLKAELQDIRNEQNRQHAELVRLYERTKMHAALAAVGMAAFGGLGTILGRII